MQVTEALEALGLTEKEAKVYLSLLELGQASGYAIAEKSGLKRPTVYILLDSLRFKGLILKVPHPKKQLFIAKPPDELFHAAESRLHMAHEVLPQLQALLAGREKPRILYFEGLTGVRELLRYGIEKFPQREIIGFYAHAEDESQELHDIFREWNASLKKFGIRSRGIVPDHPNLEYYRRTDREFGRDMRVIPLSQYSSSISIDMGDSFVRILDFRYLQGVVIENKAIARTMRQIFDLIWNARKDTSPGKDAT